MFRCWASDSEASSSEDVATGLSATWLWPSPRELSPKALAACTPRRRPVLSRGAPKACGAALVLMGLTAFAAISLAQKRPSELGASGDWHVDVFGARSELSKRPAGLTAAELLRSEQLESAGSGALLETLAQQTAFLELSLHGATAEDTKLVRSTLAESFGNVSKALKASTEALDSFGLTQGQLEALLSAVRHMADQRVQDIGATVSAALASYFKVEGADAGKEAARQRAYGEKEME